MIKKVELYIFCITIILIMAGYGLFIPIISFNVQQGISNLANQSLLLSTFAFGQFLSSPLLGSFSDHYGIKRTLLLAIIGYFMTICLTLLISNFTLVLILRIVSGIFAGGGVASVENYIAKMVQKDQKPYYYTFTSMAIGVGMTFGPVLGFVYLKHNIIVAGLILILGFAVYLLNLCLVTKDIVKQENLKSYHRTFLSDLQSISKKSKNIHILLSVFLFGFITASFESIGLLYIYQNIKLNYLTLSAIVILIVIMIYYVMVLSPKIINHYNKYKLSLIQIIIIILSLVLILFKQSQMIILIGFFGLICGMSSLISTLTTYTAQINENAGIMLGLRNSCLSIGSIFGPILVGHLYDTSESLAIVSIIIICILIMIISMSYERIKNEYI